MKKAKGLQPGAGAAQAYAIVDERGLPMVRQSMRTKGGRIAYLDLTPEETGLLIQDLRKACFFAEVDHPEVDITKYPEARIR